MEWITPLLGLLEVTAPWIGEDADSSRSKNGEPERLVLADLIQDNRPKLYDRLIQHGVIAGSPLQVIDFGSLCVELCSVGILSTKQVTHYAPYMSYTMTAWLRKHLPRIFEGNWKVDYGGYLATGIDIPKRMIRIALLGQFEDRTLNLTTYRGFALLDRLAGVYSYPDGAVKRWEIEDVRWAREDLFAQILAEERKIKLARVQEEQALKETKP